MITQVELKKVRALVAKLGLAKTAEALGISRQSLISTLAELPIRDGTASLIKTNLDTATAALSTVRGDAKPTTKREA